MPDGYLHDHKDFPDLINIVSDEHSIAPALVEKDYWIMHCLYGLQQMGQSFELKGGTSLSKGYGIIERFSEDIDIRIEPDKKLGVATNPNQQKPQHVESRKKFYDTLASEISVPGIEDVVRDAEFDDPDYYRGGGIRLHYAPHSASLSGVKDGILLEVGFDTVNPNTPCDITSWAYEYAAERVTILDNRAIAVRCYHPGYTFVEKLQTISTKYRQQQQDGGFPVNFMRHYYDAYCLLKRDEVQDFIGTEEYATHKEKRFRTGDNPVLAENQAFLLSDAKTRALYADAYARSRSLYYKSQPAFDEVMDAITAMTKVSGI